MAEEVEVNITPAEQPEVTPEAPPEEPPAETAPEPPVKKRRGRPPGSKNKPKVVVEPIQEEPEPEPEPPAPRRRKRAPSPDSVESEEEEEPPPKRRRRAPPPLRREPPQPEDMATLMLRSLRESQLARAEAKRQQYAAWF